MTLLQLVLKFRDLEMKMADPESADGECHTVSEKFISFLRQHGWGLQYERCLLKFRNQNRRYHPLRPWFISEAAILDKWDRDHEVGVWAAHWVVGIGTLRIDWTARQFDPAAHFPLVWRAKTHIPYRKPEA